MHAAAQATIVVDELALPSQWLRVAVVSETYPPEVNGVALTVARLVEGLQRRNHEVQLVRPRQHAQDAAGEGVGFHEVLMRGLPIPRYPQLRLGLPARQALQRLWSLRRPDVVHIATEGPLGWSALQAATHLKLPVTSDFRTNFHAYSRHYGVGWLRKPIIAYLRKFHNRTAATTVPTERLRQELAAVGFQRLLVVSRGVDTTLFSPARRSDELRRAWGVGPGELVVACVGRLAAEKNLELLLEAFAAIARARPVSRLLLVGDGPMREALMRRVPQAVLAGERRGEDLAAHYASADLFLFPSLTETFGNVTAEAMASSLPVLAFDYAAAAQWIRQDDNGVLVPFGDSDAFVAAAVVLAGDDVRRRRLGERAREHACRHGWDDIVARFEAMLRQASHQDAARAAAAAAHATSMP